MITGSLHFSANSLKSTSRQVTSGLITRSEALDRYALSEEELALWFGAVEQHGEEALKVTTIQKYRKGR